VISGAARRGFFITGTDTGVGKTLVAVSLTRTLVARGLRTAVMKPVAAGVTATAQGPRNDDALELLVASNVAAAYEDVNPWLLTTPASPHLAARHDGVTIGHEKILRAYARLAGAADVVVIEGAGGWHAPITASETMADVAGKLALSAPLSVILVVGLRLGCLNHALLTREAIRSRGLTVAGWVANKMQVEMPLADANIETLSTRLGAAPIAVVPPGCGRASASVPSWASDAAKVLVSP
jgi:dethiobiotin synthetase